MLSSKLKQGDMITAQQDDSSPFLCPAELTAKVALCIAKLPSAMAHAADATRHALAASAVHVVKALCVPSRRVVHAADVTGREVERALLDKARKHPNISIMECHAAVDLVIGEVEGRQQCLGLDVLDIKATGMQRIVAPVTLLASGGAGDPSFSDTPSPSLSTLPVAGLAGNALPLSLCCPVMSTANSLPGCAGHQGKGQAAHCCIYGPSGFCLDRQPSMCL